MGDHLLGSDDSQASVVTRIMTSRSIRNAVTNVAMLIALVVFYLIVLTAGKVLDVIR